MRKKAKANPKSLMARLWRWHTGWCPGWKAYQAHLAEQRSASPTACSCYKTPRTHENAPELYQVIEADCGPIEYT